jgi:hypothetical protein
MFPYNVVENGIKNFQKHAACGHWPDLVQFDGKMFRLQSSFSKSSQKITKAANEHFLYFQEPFLETYFC